MHIHLDLIGGIAGDMFVAAMLDTFPDLEKPLLKVINRLKPNQNVAIHAKHGSDMGLNGKRFMVQLNHIHSQNHTNAQTHTDTNPSSQHHAHHHHHHQHHHQHADHSQETGHGHEHDKHHEHHEHHSWSFIRQYLYESDLDEQTKNNAIGIFQLLAEAEAKVHNQPVENVTFHEVGAWDCIADIVAAAWLISHSEVNSWSMSDLPWGGGTVKCAHGNIPVPAPATMNLLLGFRFKDDGNSGERITPTGAAILAWLLPKQHAPSGILKAMGYGFGTRKLKDRANVLRASLLESDTLIENEKIANIQCDIDDMTNEMLAVAREQIRQQQGVLEVTEMTSHGKKNRIINTLTVLTKVTNLNEVIETILNTTSTIGIRYWYCDRVCLDRTEHRVTHNDVSYRVKTVSRPDGSFSSKLEADHLDTVATNYNGRIQLKRAIEQQAEETFNEHCQAN